ncbi:hypothetical protein LCGC14_2612270, partial [marine sediment metagenome]
ISKPSLRIMPKDEETGLAYGVAFGDAQFDDGDNIYVLCGLTKVINNNQPDTLNDRILRYTISTDTWTIIRPLDESLYKRIAPFGFFRDNPLPIVAQSEQLDTTQQIDDAHSSSVLWQSNVVDVQLGDVGGVDWSTFLRFPIPIRPNKVVTQAYVTLDPTSSQGPDDCQIDMYLLDSDNMPDFSTNQYSTATIGSPVRWDCTNELTVDGTNDSSPDIADLVQSFVNRSGYTLGNYIGLKLDGSPSSIGAYREVAAFGKTGGYDVPSLTVNYLDGDIDKVKGYIYSGSFPKTHAEINAEFNEQLDQALDDFRSFILTSPYYLSLTGSEQNSFITSEEERITESIVIPPYIYPATGFKYDMGSEHIDSSSDLIMDISDKLDDDWPVLPLVRDRGKAVYIANQDAVYLMGGSNQNQSTTLNRVESINMSSELNTYSHLTAFSRGRSLFQAIAIQDEIYLSGGLTSG